MASRVMSISPTTIVRSTNAACSRLCHRSRKNAAKNRMPANTANRTSVFLTLFRMLRGRDADASRSSEGMGASTAVANVRISGFYLSHRYCAPRSVENSLRRQRIAIFDEYGDADYILNAVKNSNVHWMNLNTVGRSVSLVGQERLHSRMHRGFSTCP